MACQDAAKGIRYEEKNDGAEMTSATVNSVSHALRMIEVMSGQKPLNISELARLLELPRPTVYRLVQTFMERDFLVQSGTEYRLSLRLLELSSSILSSSRLEEASKPALQKLVNVTGETAHFAILDGDRVGYISKIESDKAIRMFSRIGWRGPLHATGVGKALLAVSDDTLLDRICSLPLEAFTSATITDPMRLREELAEIRKVGFGIDREELVDGLVCVAVVVQKDNRIIGAVSVSGPSNRMENTEFFVYHLREAATALATSL
jgi:IclR family acetate operon transcriptional repressor